MTTEKQTAPPAATQPAKPAQQLKPIDEVRGVITTLSPQFKMALPAHISVEKFQRVAITAIASSPELMHADRNSLYAACMKAAQDGLLPDGREAALVTFNTNVAPKGQPAQWVKKAQYMPMVAGILKKIRNSGELKELSAHVVFQKDDFDYWIDDQGEHLNHRPILGGDRGDFRLVYAVATTNEGGRYIEVMTKGQVDEVRAVSRAKDAGPWVDWYPEMARKTVIRRLSKRLPMSTDVDEVLRRDDELYDLSGAGQPAPLVVATVQTPAKDDKDKPKRPRRLQAVVDADKTKTAQPKAEPTKPADKPADSDGPPPGHPAAETPPPEQQQDQGGDTADVI